MTADCLFCKIIAGDIPATVVHDGERTFAFRDINPQARVHVLVVPKQHHEDAGRTVFHAHLHVLGGEQLGHFGRL